MRPTIYRGIAVATLTFTSACSSADAVAPSPAPASASGTVAAGAEGVASVSRAIDQYVWVSCTNGGAGEVLRVTGELRYDVQSTKDSAGVFHFSIKSNTSDLTAVGLTTGTFYRGLMTERVNSRAEDYLNMDLRTADIIRFVAPATGDSYSLMVGSHWIVEDGSYVLYEQTWNEVCR